MSSQSFFDFKKISFYSVSPCRFTKNNFMKSLLSLACFIFSFATIGCSQKITEKDLPAPVKTAFKTKFPNATDVRWGKESQKEYEAEFKSNNTSIAANFMADGSWVVTETTISSSELPVAVINAINTKHPGAKIGTIEMVEEPGKKASYEVAITVNNKKKGVVLNADGSFIK